jgi:hypothetical protein
LTVEEILASPCQFAHVYEVRSVGPAAVIVLEREAPARLEIVAATDAEYDAISEWLRANPESRHVMHALGEAKESEEGSFCTFKRADEHGDRLAAGHEISGLRVTT